MKVGLKELMSTVFTAFNVGFLVFVAALCFGALFLLYATIYHIVVDGKNIDYALETYGGKLFSVNLTIQDKVFLVESKRKMCESETDPIKLKQLEDEAKQIFEEAMAVWDSYLILDVDFKDKAIEEMQGHIDKCTEKRSDAEKEQADSDGDDSDAGD